jgi:hypothetical protein
MYVCIIWLVCSVFMINSEKCQRRRMHYLEPVGAGSGIQHHNNHAAHDHGSKHDLPGHLQHGIAELSPQPPGIVLIWKNDLFTEISPFRELLATPAGNICTHRIPQGAGGSSRRRHLPCGARSHAGNGIVDPLIKLCWEDHAGACKVVKLHAVPCSGALE